MNVHFLLPKVEKTIQEITVAVAVVEGQEKPALLITSCVDNTTVGEIKALLSAALAFLSEIPDHTFINGTTEN